VKINYPLPQICNSCEEFNLIVTGYREQDRIARVLRVLHLIPEVTQLKIEKIGDHKGTLVVYWNQKPIPADFSYVNRAWEFEGECEVNHYFSGKQIEKEV